MRVVFVAAIMTAVVFAGCSDSAGPKTETDDGFDDVDVEVTAETGAILGVVINDAIVPVEGATVKVLSTPFNSTTDAQGRFAFGKLEPGVYFIEVSKPLHEKAQTSVNVAAGVKDPPILKVQLNRQYEGEPYYNTIPNHGFFTCTQDGAIVWGYSSSPCHSVCVWTFVLGCAATFDGCETNTVCTDQQRDFHADVEAGWQTMIWEMKWEPSASGTSPGMGIVVSTYKPERAGSHWFAEFEGFESPLYGRLDCAAGEDGECTEGDSASGVEPVAVPKDGMTDMSYFMSVRGDSAAPAFAIDQSFDVWLTQFYYAPAPEGWSFVNGSPDPF